MTSNNNKLEQLINNYSKINPIKQLEFIYPINKHIAYYLADQNKQIVSVNNKYILELDIRSAFPTICKYLYNDTNKEFVDNIFMIDDKLQRNIYIANTLKHYDGELKKLNLISKMVVIGVLAEITKKLENENILILEFKKDGCLFWCDDKIRDKIYDIINSNIDNSYSYCNFVLNNEFVFHVDKYDTYIRCNRTSWFWDKDSQNLTIKGQYKQLPEYLRSINIKFLSFQIDYNFAAKELQKIYSPEYSKILFSNNIEELLEKYYFCDKEQKLVLTIDGKYQPLKRNVIEKIDPKLYLKYFVYPIIFSIKNV